MSRVDFDDQSSLHGFYVAVIRLVDRIRGHQRGAWWYERHPLLGQSPLSALCDGSFDAVHAVAQGDVSV